MSSWKRLEKADDWGLKYYAELGYAKPRGLADARIGIHFSGEVDVRFPDGVESRLPVAVRHYSYSVGDHGHVHEGRGRHYGVMVDLHGLSVWVDLVDLEVRF